MSVEMNWETQKLCTDINNYELVVEKQKTAAQCSQNKESWKWIVSFRGAIVSTGSVNKLEDAQQLAIANVPK
ncbi:MAG: hypothetical protein WBK55_09570 [Alphaproteobacteria bacterium]